MHLTTPVLALSGLRGLSFHMFALLVPAPYHPPAPQPEASSQRFQSASSFPQVAHISIRVPLLHPANAQPRVSHILCPWPTSPSIHLPLHICVAETDPLPQCAWRGNLITRFAPCFRQLPEHHSVPRAFHSCACSEAVFPQLGRLCPPLSLSPQSLAPMAPPGSGPTANFHFGLCPQWCTQHGIDVQHYAILVARGWGRDGGVLFYDFLNLCPHHLPPYLGDERGRHSRWSLNFCAVPLTTHLYSPAT